MARSGWKTSIVEMADQSPLSSRQQPDRARLLPSETEAIRDRPRARLEQVRSLPNQKAQSLEVPQRMGALGAVKPTLGTRNLQEPPER